MKKLPKYLRIKKELEEEIENGEFKAGELFYTEAQLIQRFGVSSITVIRAIKEMADEGYLTRQQGKGTFVSRMRKRKTVLFSDVESFKWNSDSSQIIEIRKEKEPKILKKMKLKKSASYYTIERMHLFEGKPFIYHENHLPTKLINPKRKTEAYSSVYQSVREEFGVDLSKKDFKEWNKVTMDVPEKVRKALFIDDQTPVMYQEKIVVLESGEVGEYSIAYKKWDYFNIEFETPSFEELYE